MSIQSIGSNISAFAAQGNIGIASDKASASISRLSSGNRINKASDDVAGLAVGTSLRTQVNTLRSALTNATQGTSLLQIADGGLGQIIDILQRQMTILLHSLFVLVDVVTLAQSVEKIDHLLPDQRK